MSIAIRQSTIYIYIDLDPEVVSIRQWTTAALSKFLSMFTVAMISGYEYVYCSVSYTNLSKCFQSILYSLYWLYLVKFLIYIACIAYHDITIWCNDNAKVIGVSWWWPQDLFDSILAILRRARSITGYVVSFKALLCFWLSSIHTCYFIVEN